MTIDVRAAVLRIDTSFCEGKETGLDELSKGLRYVPVISNLQASP